MQQVLRLPANNKYYIYTNAYQSLVDTLIFKSQSQAVQLLYTINPTNANYGMLVNTATQSAVAYTVSGTSVKFSWVPLSALATAETRVILTLQNNQVGGRFLVAYNNKASDLSVNAQDGSMIETKDNPNPIFYYSSIPLFGATDPTNLNIYDCGMYDPLTNGPLMKKYNCPNIAYNDNQKQKLIDAYCSRWPVDPTAVPMSDLGMCLTACKDPSKVCHYGLKQLCQGDNLLSDTCQNYCRLPDVNCDAPLTAYCSQFTAQQIDQSNNPALKQACGCYMSQAFYDKYFQSFSDKVDYKQSAIRPAISSCYFPMCSAPSSLKPFYFKKAAVQCPVVQECVQDIQFANDGTIVGDINIQQNNKCNFSSR